MKGLYRSLAVAALNRLRPPGNFLSDTTKREYLVEEGLVRLSVTFDDVDIRFDAQAGAVC